MTAHNWSKPTNSRPGGKAWVRNYSTMAIGVEATAITINSKNGKRYSEILKKVTANDPEFPDSWFDSPKVIAQFTKWGGSGGDGIGYSKGVKSNYKNSRRRQNPINTNKPGGRSAKCLLIP